jgi:hypothetical protein
LDLVGGGGGEGRVHTGADCGEHAIELDGQLANGSPRVPDLGSLGPLVVVGGKTAARVEARCSASVSWLSHPSTASRMRSSRIAVLRGWPVSA